MKADAKMLPSVGAPLKTLLICHEEAELDRVGLGRWLGSFSEVVGIVVIREKGGRKWKRIRREIERVGVWRFLDVLAFRVYYKLRLAGKDRRWEVAKLEELKRVYPSVSAPEILTQSPNSAEAERFIREAGPDIVVARCKTLLKESVFRAAKTGTFVMHPGVCPEYRNAHGCFWAMANGDWERVGMTLLKVDIGVDTGPVYGYYRCALNEAEESHIVVQHRVVLDNLDALKQKLLEIEGGDARPVDVSGRESRAWGQPWLSRYVAWKRRVKVKQACE
jgi:folate-dependent phosphoribosylglycinamide formyltransferase PurN